MSKSGEQAELERTGRALLSAAQAAEQLAARILAGQFRPLARRQPPLALQFSRALLARFEITAAPGSTASATAERFELEPLPAPQTSLVVSPYAPPQRQLSAARQGAAMWSKPEPAERTAARPLATRQHPAPRPGLPAGPVTREPDKIPDDLQALLQLHRSRGRVK